MNRRTPTRRAMVIAALNACIAAVNVAAAAHRAITGELTGSRPSQCQRGGFVPATVCVAAAARAWDDLDRARP